MDSTELNKIAGAVIGALLVFMLLGFFSNKIFGLGPGGHHGEEQLAFAVELEGAESAEDDAPVAVDYAALVGAADPGAGEKVFNKCKSCHKVEDGANGVGPHLWGVVGRDIASVGGFGYSDVLNEAPGDWTLTELSAFLEDPKGYAPGTKMAFKGLSKPEDRVNLIVWLNNADGTPIELAAAAAPTAVVETVAAPATSEEPAAPAASEETSEQAAAPAATEETAPASTEETNEQAAAPAASEETAAAPAASEETTAVAAAGSFPAGDAAKGEKVFRKCKACHKMEEGKNGVGPHLWGVINRDIASVEGYAYSDALTALPGDWTATELSAFLEKPKNYVAGTKMAFGGLKKEEDRVNLITYLNEADGTPDPLN